MSEQKNGLDFPIASHILPIAFDLQYFRPDPNTPCSINLAFYLILISLVLISNLYYKVKLI